jgi:hypothetical protein
MLPGLSVDVAIKANGSSLPNRVVQRDSNLSNVDADHGIDVE